MLLHEDVRLDAVIRALVNALSYARAFVASSGNDAVRADVDRELDGCLERLAPRSTELKRWGEAELAARLQTLADNLRLLRAADALELAQLDKFSEQVDFALTLHAELAAISPLEQSPAAWRWSQAEPAIEQRHLGCALAIEFSRPKLLWDTTLFRPIRAEIADARGIRLMYEPSNAGEGGRTMCDFLAEAGSRPREIVRSKGDRLVGAGGKLLANAPGESRGLGYFFVPAQEQPSLLTRLLRLTWTLAGLAQHGLRFKIVAAPAALVWRESGPRSATALRAIEQDAIFDLLGDLLDDRALDNTLILHPALRPTDSKVKQWFTPSWRLPYNRGRTSRDAAFEWLWTTAAFPGLPGSVGGPDLLDALKMPVVFESGSPEDEQRSKPRESVPPLKALPERRAPGRVALRHQVLCRLELPDEPKRRPAYLLDYSATGCRVSLPAADENAAHALRRRLESGEAKLVVPKGLYWPWSNAMLSRLDDGPRIVQMSLQGPKPVVRSEARECYLDISLLYGPQATEA